MRPPRRRMLRVAFRFLDSRFELAVLLVLRSNELGSRGAVTAAGVGVIYRLGFHGELTLGPLSPHKWALMGGVGALVNSYG